MTKDLKYNESKKKRLDLLPPVVLENIIGKVMNGKTHLRLLAVNRTISNVTGISFLINESQLTFLYFFSFKKRYILYHGNNSISRL